MYAVILTEFSDLSTVREVSDDIEECPIASIFARLRTVADIEITIGGLQFAER